jgi:oxygen-independent coproporphyrinogen-3 oxidase
VHEDTPLYFKVKKNSVRLIPDDAMVDLYIWSIAYLNAHGFAQYELSNFAKEGYHSRHNSVYWQRKPYKAFGLGACSFDGNQRFGNQKNLMAYIKTMNEGGDPTVFCEDVSTEQVYLERMMLGLRQAEGIDIQEYIQDLGQAAQEVLYDRIDMLEKKSLLVKKGNRIALTPAGLAMHNEVTVQLMPQDV